MKEKEKKRANIQVKEPKKCNCRKEECPLEGECIVESVVYKAKIKDKNSNEVVYYGSTDGHFKQRLYNHRTDFRFDKNKNNTTLAQHVWKMKEKKESVNVKWSIVKKCKKYKSGSKMCDVCLSEKLEILKGRKKGEKMLNKRSELMNKCRHKRKFISEP